MRRPRGLSLLALSVALGALSNGLAKDPIFTTIDFPGATQTDAHGINPRGDIVGRYDSADGVTHGYLLSRGKFTSIDFPGANFTVAFGITPRGNIVGRYFSADGVGHGYLLSRGQPSDRKDDCDEEE